MAGPLIKFEKVTLGYPGQDVLYDIDLEINPRETTVIAGPSGCGKSTLLRAAIGLLRPVSGRIWLLGEEPAHMDEMQLSPLRRRVGMLFQGGALINSMSVEDNVALPLRQFLRLEDMVIETLVRYKLAQVGLEEHRHKIPPELSGGMRKRAALARSLALDPELLLCDEPTAGLDPLTAAAMDRLLVDLSRALGMTLVVVTHEVGSIEAIADRVVLISGGRIVFDGTLASARSSSLSAVRDFFDRKATPPHQRGRSVLEQMQPR